MKIFLLLLVIVASTFAADISLPQGYNYNPQQNYQNDQQPLIMHILAGLTQTQHGQRQSQQSVPVMQQITQPSQHYLPSQPESLPMPLGFASFPSTPVRTMRRMRPRVKVSKKPIVTKNFFIHAAPEETDDEIQEELTQLASQPRKHYNVLFVKTPSQTSRAAALNLAKALKEEKTVVYVLSKKTSASDLQDAIAEMPQQINKPEVFFIKYRTPEEAINAQRQIQAQYDSLGGSSTITDEGVSPVTSVVGSLDEPLDEPLEDEINESQYQDNQVNQQFDQSLVNSINNINSQYLPPSNQY